MVTCIAKAKQNIQFAACNCVSPRGNRLRKDREAKAGETFEVVEFFISDGLATHGEECVKVRDREGNILATFARYFEFQPDVISRRKQY